MSPPGGPREAARPADVSWQAAGRRLLTDRVATRFVVLGGVTIIASILAILFVIAAEVLPLFAPPAAAPLPAVRLAAPPATPPLALGVDEYREIALLVSAGGIQLASARDGSPLPAPPLPALGGARIVSASPLGRGPFALGLSDGRVIPAEVRFGVAYQGSRRILTPEVTTDPPLLVDPAGRSVRRLAFAVTQHGPLVAAQVGPRELLLILTRETKALIGPGVRTEARIPLALPPGDGEVTALALDNRGEGLYIGTSRGQLIRVPLQEEAPQPDPDPPVQATLRPGAGVSLLGFALGDRTLVVGGQDGSVTSWRPIRTDGGEPALQRIQTFRAHPGPVVAFAPSRRDKGFLTADGAGGVQLHYATTGETLLTLAAAAPDLRALAYAPKADGFLLGGADGALAHYTLQNPHPEITLRGLFGKVWYEGYDAPAHVWQSTGATDDFESKLSLTPLLYGTLKGTFYALLFAVPVALLAALYASQFMHPALKGIVKPTVEIMAAMPSVVLGFLAGLWLAPRIETVVPGIFLAVLVIPLLILLTVSGWRVVPSPVRRRLRAGSEVALLVPVVLGGLLLSFVLGGLLEAWLLQGDYRTWLLAALGLTYDQRNSLVVGIAMGFAVIPIIFTIAEDSLSNVPQHLVAGSLALGATRWQTAVRVVLPTASPGIFSAVMIGFGRAVGETMIVLMATGNTPVMDWSIFNGFRALSANIAVELPEAPVGGTLFRVLFLAAFLLFLMTFLVNTAAEIIRLRLRRRYRYL